MKSWRFLIPAVALIAAMVLPAATAHAASAAPAAPVAPTGVTATPGNQSATVTWTGPAFAAIYRMAGYQLNVYRNGKSAYLWHVSVPGNATTWTVKGLTNNQTYRFTVQAKLSTITEPLLESAWSIESTPSNPVVPGIVPGAPAGVDAHGTYQTELVTWAAPAYSGTSGPTQYQVNVYKQDGNGMFQLVQNPQISYLLSPTGTLARVTQLDFTGVYRFTVQARNATGWGAESAPTDSAVPGALIPVNATMSSAATGSGSVTVSWFGPSGFSISHYLVLVYQEGSGLVTYRDGVSSAPLTISGLTNGVAYIVEVHAVDFNHMMSGGAQVRIVPQAPVPPPAPVNLRATLGDRLATLYWDNPSSNPNAPIDHYAVHVYLGSTLVWANENVHFTGVQVPGLIVGQTYRAEVSSVSTANVTSTAASLYFTAATVPSAPMNVSATYSNGRVTVTWSPSAYNGGSPITGYLVTSTGSLPQDTGTLTVGPNQTSAIIDNLPLGRTYTFTVQGINGIGVSLPSAASFPVTIATLPGAPRNITATAGDESITVKWDTPSTDGGSAITGYQVTASDGVHAPIVVRVTGTSATLVGLTNGTAYTVSVAAINALGMGSPAAAIAIPRNLAPTITVPAALTVHHGDVVNATITASDPESSDHLVLGATGLPKGVTFTDQGNGTGLLAGNADVPAGTYTLTFSVNDGHNALVSQSMMLTVTREQAEVRLFPTAPLSVVLTKAGQTQAKSLTIRATIREVTDPNGYADIGEAADVTYTLTSVQTGATYSWKAATTGHGIEGTLTAKYTFHNIPRGIYQLHISVGGSYYEGAAEAMVAVSSVAVHGGVTGSGQVEVPGNNASAHFQFKAQRSGSGKLSGSLLYIEQRAGVAYTFRSTAITALVFKGHTAYIQGIGTLNGVGQHQFVATVVDNHHQGRTDRFGLRVIDGNFVTVNHCTFGPVDLTSGQARIVHG
jgi:hypothetical protein